MKVLVTVKEVGEVGDDFDIAGTAIEESDLEYDLNEWDDYALEEAVQISEANDDVEVVTASIGTERSEETIRKGLAKGADRAVRIWDDALAETDLLDVETKADLFAAIVEEEEPDLVLTGAQAADTGFGATGVALAERVGYQWGAIVNQLDLDPDEGIASVHRELEGGIEELTDIELPAVLTIQTGINDPRYASLRGIRQAQQKELAVKDLADVGVDAAELENDLEITEMYEPESDSDAQLWEGSADETAGKLATFLRDKGVVGE